MPNEDRYRALFAEIDTAKTGKVDFSTFEQAMKDNSRTVSNIELMFRNIDLKHDNVIDYDEFKRYMVQAEEQILIGWKRIDADNDGRVSTRDLNAYLADRLPETDKHQFDVFYSSVFGRGSITYDQWRDLLLYMPRRNGSRLESAFSYYHEEANSEGDVAITDDFVKGFGFFLAGGLSGVVSRTCTAPFDRIKVFLIARTDLSSTLLHSKQEISHGQIPLDRIKSPLVKAATSLYRQGGLRAFYVGNGLNVIKVFPESAMKFGSFEAAKRLLQKIEGQDELSRFSTYLAGGMGGVVAQFTVYPIDTLKYRVQCAKLDSSRKGVALLMKTAKDMYQAGGLKMFYRGVLVGVTGIFPYAAMDLGTFNSVKKYLLTKQAAAEGKSIDEVQLSNLIVVPLGAFSGTVGATMVYPINLLRTRLQAQGTFAHPYTYTGFSDVLKQTIAREGYPGLFKGLVPNLAKVIPAVSISYLCYENLKRAMNLE